METVKGNFVYKNLAIAQVPHVESFMKNLLQKVMPKRIIEIGTFHGGLTLMLRDILDEIGLDDSIITTYDIYEQTLLKPLVSDHNVHIKTETVFCNQYKQFVDDSTKQALLNYIHNDGVTMVICDGGNKIAEFNLFSELIKPGDIIMAHDYAFSTDYFNEHVKDKLWNWHEIQYSDIQNSCQQYNLEPFSQDEAAGAVWACFKKVDNQ